MGFEEREFLSCRDAKAQRVREQYSSVKATTLCQSQFFYEPQRAQRTQREERNA